MLKISKLYLSGIEICLDFILSVNFQTPNCTLVELKYYRYRFSSRISKNLQIVP